jgi:hypothetical protein
MKKLFITLATILVGANPAIADTTPYQRFQQIQSGMTITQVESILGFKCVLQSESSFVGITSRMWDCPVYPYNSIPSVMVMTQNNRVISKTQIGLG